MPSFPGVSLVGTHFRPPEAKEYVSALAVGDELVLEREPENEYDQNAIRVLSSADGIHLGYLARDQAVWIAPYLDEGTTFTTTVVGFEFASRTTYPILDLHQND
jgi:hypothetical protein